VHRASTSLSTFCRRPKTEVFQSAQCLPFGTSDSASLCAFINCIYLLTYRLIQHCPLLRRTHRRLIQHLTPDGSHTEPSTLHHYPASLPSKLSLHPSFPRKCLSLMLLWHLMRTSLASTTKQTIFTVEIYANAPLKQVVRVI